MQPPTRIARCRVSFADHAMVAEYEIDEPPSKVQYQPPTTQSLTGSYHHLELPSITDSTYDDETEALPQIPKLSTRSYLPYPNSSHDNDHKQSNPKKDDTAKTAFTFDTEIIELTTDDRSVQDMDVSSVTKPRNYLKRRIDENSNDTDNILEPDQKRKRLILLNKG